MFQALVCDGVTGKMLDRVQVADFTWEQLISAGGSGSVTLPLDGIYSRSQLRTLAEPWSRIWALAYGERVLYMGYVVGRTYNRESNNLTVQLTDLWALLDRRGAWDHSAPDVSKWRRTVSGSLAAQAAAAIRRGRDVGPPLPAMGLPLTIPTFGGASVTRTYYGYNVEMVGEVLSNLMDEGLDIAFEPRFIGNGDTDWLMEAGPNWGSGRVHELMVTAPHTVVTAFSEVADGARLTNNARRIGEGSEEDMVIRSNRNTASPYPLLDRSTAVKQINDPSQLSAQANNDLKLYGYPTFQWDFTTHLDEGIRIGDTVRLHFDGDPWIADGWHERRVVKLSGAISPFVTVGLQPTGGG